MAPLSYRAPSLGTAHWPQPCLYRVYMQVNNLIRIWNNGDGIPVEIHKEEKVYVPELIFGHLLTSSNYDDNEKKVRHMAAIRGSAALAVIWQSHTAAANAWFKAAAKATSWHHLMCTPA